MLTGQTLAGAGHDAGPGRERFRIDGVGVFSSGGPIGRATCRYILVWDVISLSGAFLALPPGPVEPAAGYRPGSARAATGRSSSHPSRVTLFGSGLLPGLRPYRHRPRPCAYESRDLVARAVARGMAGRCAGCTHRNHRNAEAVRPGPGRLAGQSITLPYQGLEGRGSRREGRGDGETRKRDDTTVFRLQLSAV